MSLAQHETEFGPKCDAGCGGVATHVVICHQIDHCKDEDTPPSGSKSFLFCETCMKGICDIIATRVREMKKAVAQNNRELTCMSCNMVITRLSQVLNVEHLKDGVMAGE